ncbi:conserved exported hypothetical protein [Candidatus Sulfopaludibacter sp. SbA4]|nr:conserved exported hypothetical protein [Candidatus Sulfopaludibacter sp. SbA4]
MKQVRLSAFAAALWAARCFAQAPVPINPTPSRIVGHPKSEQNGQLASYNPNLVEGRELWSPQGVALDTSVTPPILYVSDGNNNRVLAWKNATDFRTGLPADLVIGQQDLFHTDAQGPGIGLQTGLYGPSGLAVFKGDLYVADTNNNRILRYPQPFANAGNEFPDLYIGQPSLNSRSANYLGQVDRQGINLAGVGSSLAFDSAGNLWITDPGNRRVLRFKATDIAGTGGPLTADLEIGQPLGFTDVRPALKAPDLLTGNVFAAPLALGFDPSGRLFVCDSDGNQFNRVLVFPGPFTSNAPTAARIMGVFGPGQTPTQDQQSKTVMLLPSGLFFIPGASGKVGVLDAGYNRILLFDSYDKWPDQATSYSPQATGFVGQLTFNGSHPNGGLGFVPPATSSTLYLPAGAFFSGTELYVADSGNNRVIGLPFQGGNFSPANGLWGQDTFSMMQANLIEGREFYFANVTQSGTNADAGIALDTSGDTPHLYVSDPFNHRVLGFKDFRKLTPGSAADIVIGQADFNSGLCNATGDPNHPTQSSLCHPTGVLVDSNGNLYVADTGNGRVLRFPAPFAHKGSEQADLVLGQHNFTSTITDPTPSTMARPYGLAFAGNIGLLVSDVGHNRMLFFPFTANATFNPPADNGMAATKVFGQPDFTSSGSGNTDANMNGPHHIAADTDTRPYVTDSGNNRVLIFDSVLNNPTSGAHASLILPGLSNPQGIYVNAATGEVWITDTNSSSALVRKYPKFQTLQFTPASTGVVQAANSPLAVAQDQYGDVIVADSSNRVGFYFPGLQGINGVNFLPTRSLAPGVLASICASGSSCNGGAAYFGANTALNSDLPNPYPLPATLGDVQVLFNGQPAPLYYVSPTQINFVVPNLAPTSGTADVVVVQASTGRVYAAGPVAMNTVSPAIFAAFTGTQRQAAVINQDNSINTTTNAAARGSVITIYATGQGYLPNAPPDGSAPPSLVQTPSKPTVFLNACDVDDSACTQESGEHIMFSGLSPQFPGVWQINVKIPQNTGIGPQIIIAVIVNSVSSFDAATAGWSTTIAVK